MGVLAGLPGTNGRKIDVRFFGSVTAAMKLLNADGATTVAGAEGAINIYKDDKGMYRGILCVHRDDADTIVTKTKKDLRVWLKTTLPKIYTVSP